MPWLLSMLALVPLVLAGRHWFELVNELKRKLPQDSGEEFIRSSTPIYIWTSTASDRARKSYVRFHIWGSVASLILAAAAWIGERPIGAAGFLGIAVFGAALILIQTRKYRWPGSSSR